MNLQKSKKHHTLLTKRDRERIEEWLGKDFTQAHIAKNLGVNRSTISLELGKGKDSQGNYRAIYAEKQAVKRIRSRKLAKRKLLLNIPLQTFVHEKLQATWSPTQISQEARNVYTDETMHISHEAIYQYIYVLPRGSLKKTLVEGLRQSRKYRRTQRQAKEDEEMRGKIKDMLSIEERPKEVESRTIPGHWEGDLIIGKYKRSAVATLVERTTRYTIIVPLVKKDAMSVRIALSQALCELPLHMKKTLTYDQGKEMSQHKKFTIDTGIQVYFAHPSSPWERGTNENTNGLIRQFFPKGTDFSLVSREELQRAQDLLNGRPRKCLDWRYPVTVFSELVALDF